MSAVRRVLVVSSDYVGPTMAGPAIRMVEFARRLSQTYEVTLAVPFPTEFDIPNVEIVVARPNDDVRLTRLARRFQVVLAFQRLPMTTMLSLAGSGTRTIYDLYAPVLVERLALQSAQERTQTAALLARADDVMQKICLLTGDAFICASERQRDFWIGELAALGRINRDRYSDDPTLRDFVAVVPFGIPADEPVQGAPMLRGVVPGINAEDKILIWAGGLWEWLDPLTVIRAVGELWSRRDDIKLYFLGVTHPSPESVEMAMPARAIALAEQLGLRDRAVFFNMGWTPYQERGGYLAEADLGVSAHFDNLESRYAFRTRLLDCLWARTPVVTTSGDVLSDLVVERELGRVVGVGDIAGWAAAVEELLDRREVYERVRANLDGVREQFLWQRVTEPLERLIAHATSATPASARAWAAAVEYLPTLLRLSVSHRGVGGATATIAQRLASLVGTRFR